ncbi:g10895 [Coccomyxa elongata]
MAEERRSLFGRFGGAAPEAGQQDTATSPRSISGSTPAFITSSSAQLVNNPAATGTAVVNDVQQNRLTRRTHRPEPRQVFNLNHSEFILTWGSEFPDKLKIRQEIKLWPLRFKLRADYSRLNRSFEYGCSCKDALLGGRIRVNVPLQEVEYRKRVPLYNGHMGVTARASYAGVLAPGFHLRPTFGFEYELGGGAAIFAGNQFNLRHQFRLSRGLGVEVCGNAQLPTPNARYSWQHDSAQELSVGEGAFKLHVDQVNVVVNL